MLTVAVPKRNKLQNIIVLTPKDGWIYSIEKESPINHETKAVKIYVEFYSLLCIIEVSETI